MPNRPHLFEEFPPVSKAEWLEQIRRDLKGKAVEELDWQVSTLRVSPFHHLDDRAMAPMPFSGRSTWEAAEDIPATDLLAANKCAHRAIAEGMSSLRFILCEPLGDHRMEGLLDGIDPQSISLHFFEKNRNAEPVTLLRHLHHTLVKVHVDSAVVKGGLAWAVEVPLVVDDLVLLLEFVDDHLPNFKVLPVGVGLDWTDANRTVDNLAALLAGMDHWLSTLTEAGFEAETIFRRMFLHMGVNDNYFVGLTSLRATSLLTTHLARTWGVALNEPMFLDVYFSPYAQSADPYRQLLAATTRAMAAIAGGATRLTIAPPDAIDTEHPTTPDEFRHLVRNVHHILRLESYFDAVSDPAAGSYFFENLTERLAAAAWQQFSDAQ